MSMISQAEQAVDSDIDATKGDAAAIRKHFADYFKPLTTPKPGSDADRQQVDLGRRLFFERALSADGTISCNDCHDLSKYGTNGEAAIKARKAGTFKRDVPSIYNIADLKLMGWAGEKSDLRAYTAKALTAAEHMGKSDGDVLARRLQDSPRYRERFKRAFGDERVTFERIVDALTAFEKGLVTPGPFDAFLSGDDKALDADQLKGARLFSTKNCGACHTGSAIGGQMHQKAGIVRPWPNLADTGYYEISRNPGHKWMFRVPPLRNVAETGPYFHDHSARSLGLAVYLITLHEQDMYLSQDEIRYLEAFLKSFTGKLPSDYIKQPKEIEKDNGR